MRQNCEAEARRQADDAQAADESAQAAAVEWLSAQEAIRQLEADCQVMQKRLELEVEAAHRRRKDQRMALWQCRTDLDWCGMMGRRGVGGGDATGARTPAPSDSYAEGYSDGVDDAVKTFECERRPE